MWAKIINILTGLWLMVAPGILGYGSAAADNGHIIGPIIITFSVVSLWEATHSVRKWNYPFALWLLLAPWILSYSNTLAIVSDMAAGILVIVLSTLHQEIKSRFGGGWASLWHAHPEHADKNQGEI